MSGVRTWLELAFDDLELIQEALILLKVERHGGAIHLAAQLDQLQMRLRVALVETIHRGMREAANG